MNISIKNLNFKYKNKVIFDNFNLEIKENSITAIIGQNGCGKSTLIKVLVGLLRYNGIIKIGNKLLIKDNIKDIRKEIGIVFENTDNQFVAETVMDDIAFTLENMNYKKNIIKSKIEEVTKYLGIFDILEQSPYNLNSSQKQLVSLASALVHDPKILILDEALTMIDPLEKDKILNILLELKEKGMTIILVTHDIEETLISDEIVLIDGGKVVLQADKDLFYKEEKLLKDYGFKLPFMIELSNRLIFYGLLDSFIYDMKEMVNLIWK